MRLLSILAIVGLAVAANTACKSTPKKETTEHGHTYVNHTKLNGMKPQVGDKVLMHIDVFIGDSMFNSTRKNGGEPVDFEVPDPKEVPAGRQLSPLFDALFIGTKGDSMTFYQKVDSTIQAQLPEQFKKVEYVRYEMSFRDIISKADMDKKKEEATARFSVIQTKMTELAASYKAGKLGDKITATPSGLKVLIEEKGSGKPLAKGEKVEAHYYGCLTDGKMFDNSFQRGEPLGFGLGMGQMIPGFDEGTQQLNHGGKAVFFIPPALGYGDKASGPIPANSELIFYVEVQ